MILILICLMSVTTIAVYGAVNSKCDDLTTAFLCPIILVFGFIGLIAYCFFAYSFFAAEHKASIINSEYGTNYSQSEVFYAIEVIEKIQKLDRNRCELNGNIIKGEQ